jgi:guanylate cyclase, other
LYEVFSRKEPYEGEDPTQVLQQVVDPKASKRPPVPPMCPPKVTEIMKECLKRNPFDRPLSMDLDVRLKMMTVDQLEPVNCMTNKKVIERTQDLLSQLFPKHAADALRAGRKVEPKSHECVTVFFADIVGYTSISSELSPTKVSSLLDRLYTQFDALCDIHDVFKVETVSGIPVIV